MLKRNNQETGFVLRVESYKEFDAMVWFLGESHGLMRLVIRSYFKSNNKKQSLGLEFSKVEYQFNYRKNSLLTLQTGQLINAYSNLRKDFEKLIYASLLSEIIIRFCENNEGISIYEYVESFFDNNASTSILIKILVYIIEKNGIRPQLSSCVLCDSTQINSFSISEGGLLCSKHSNRRDEKNFLIQIISAFLGAEVLEDDKDDIIDFLVKYIEFHEGMRFNSWLLKK